jgi:transcriptional regulator with XRE-family HTH domain
MPVSVGRHNLARLRARLSLTQADVAKLAGCSTVTIKAVEILKLALSDSLASRISRALWIDKEWLLKNDLNEPVPESYHFPPTQDEAAQDAVVTQLFVMTELFSRLFGVLASMEKDRHRKLIEFFIQTSLDFVKNNEQMPDSGPSYVVGSGSIEFFIRYPELFPPELKSWVNLKGLLNANLQLHSDSHAEVEESSSPMPRKARNQTRRKA